MFIFYCKSDTIVKKQGRRTDCLEDDPASVGGYQVTYAF